MMWQAPALHAVEPDPFSADIEYNLKNPPVGRKHAEAVVQAMAALERAIAGTGLKASRVRSGEVVMVTIPCSTLFAPGKTDLKPGAGAVLSKLNSHIRSHEKYKVVIAVHADNTGDEEYADRLTSERTTAIDQYYCDTLGHDVGIIPYGLGSDEPVAPNTGVRNRAANRRVEIYFIPTKEFIDSRK